MSKKYYWLKLERGYFKKKAIKKLRKIAGGDTYAIIYLEIQLLSIENEGSIFFEGYEDTFAEELALELDEDTEDVKMTLLYLQKNSLLEIRSEDEYFVPEAANSIGSETATAERMRRCRARKKLSQCDTTVTKRYTEKEIELEKDKYISPVGDTYCPVAPDTPPPKNQKLERKSQRHNRLPECKTRHEIQNQQQKNTRPNQSTHERRLHCRGFQDSD